MRTRLHIMDTRAWERFDAKVDRQGPDDCWPWLAARQSGGYGIFHPEHGVTARAHRLALERSLGRPILPGMFACHSCDRPECCNPAHLFEGTNAANVADAVSKMRHKRGSSDPRSKLTEEQVVALRESAAEGVPLDALGKEFGISASLVTMIVRGNRWRHAGGPITHRYRKEHQHG